MIETNTLTPSVTPSRWSQLKTLVKTRWPLLNFAQKLYTISCVLLLLNLITAFQFISLQCLLGLAAISAVTIDIWDLFEHLWHKLAGKTFLVAIYLVLANYGYALAQSQVNTLVGVRPDLVPHSVHMYLFLLAPLWCFVLACVVLVLYTALHATKGVLLLFLRPFGVRSHHLLNEAHPVLFMLIRVLLLPVTMTYLSIAISGYLVPGAQLGTDFNFLGNNPQQSIGLDRQLGGLAVTLQQDSGQQKAQVAVTKPSAAARSGEEENPLQGQTTTDLLWVDRVVASFLYKVESMSRSQCQLRGTEHLVPLNDYEVLIIKPDAKEASGFKFFTRLCNSANVPEMQLVNPDASQ